MSTTKLPLPEKLADEAWCSEACKRKILDEIAQRYPCKQKFSRTDVVPLYALGLQRLYRVTLWVNDWSNDATGPLKEIWKTFSVTLEGAERKVVSIEEDRKKKMEIGESGLKLKEELGL